MVAGFIILGGLIIYLIISLLAVWLGIRVAKERGRAGWKGGLFMSVVMYLILFWDLIPFRVAHEYYCVTEGGFTLNKTLDEWKRENPGIVETLKPIKDLKSLSIVGGERRRLNERFAWDSFKSIGFLGVRKKDERIVDLLKNENLAQYVDFDSNQHSHDFKSFRDFKIWIYEESCEDTKRMPEKIRFNDYLYAVKKIGSGKNGNN